MKKTLLIISALLVLPAIAFAAVFNSAQVGTNPVNNYILQTNGSTSTWVPNSGGGTGVGTVSTSTIPTIGNLAYWTSKGYPSLLGSVATGTISTSGGITSTAGAFIVGSPLTIGCSTASGSVMGCLSSTDWTTFNNKQVAGNYLTALTGDGTASGPGSAAFTLATVNTNVGTFTYPSVTVNAKGLITAISNGVAPVTSVTAVTATWPVLSSGGFTPNISWGGLATSSNLITGQNLYITGPNTVASEATGTIAAGTGISVSGTPYALNTGTTITNTGVTSIVAGTNITISGSTGAVTVNAAGGGSSSVGPINTLQASNGSGGFLATGTPQLTVGYITATSTVASSTFAGGLTSNGITTTNLIVTPLTSNEIPFINNSGNNLFTGASDFQFITGTTHSMQIGFASADASGIAQLDLEGPNDSGETIWADQSDNSDKKVFLAMFNDKAGPPVSAMTLGSNNNAAGQDAYGRSYTGALQGAATIRGSDPGEGFTDSGDLQIGGYNAVAITMKPAGTVFANALSTSANQNALCINNTTKEVVNSGGATCVGSSGFLKDDITDISPALAEEVMNLDPRQYVYKDSKDARYGFIAEEVAKIDPKLVVYATATSTQEGHTFKPGDPYSIDYERYTALLTKYVQDLSLRVDAISSNAKRSAEENWQWIAIGLLALGLIGQQIQIKKLKK